MLYFSLLHVSGKPQNLSRDPNNTPCQCSVMRSRIRSRSRITAYFVLSPLPMRLNQPIPLQRSSTSYDRQRIRNDVGLLRPPIHASHLPPSSPLPQLHHSRQASLPVKSSSKLPTPYLHPAKSEIAECSWLAPSPQ